MDGKLGGPGGTRRGGDAPSVGDSGRAEERSGESVYRRCARAVDDVDDGEDSRWYRLRWEGS